MTASRNSCPGSSHGGRPGTRRSCSKASSTIGPWTAGPWQLGDHLDAQVLDGVEVGVEIRLVEPKVPRVVEPVYQQHALSPGLSVEIGGIFGGMGNAGAE